MKATVSGIGLRWTTSLVIVVLLIGSVVMIGSLHQRVATQKRTVQALVAMGAVCLYDYEYDFDESEGRIPNYSRVSSPSPVLRFLLGKDWLRRPIYVQATGAGIHDGNAQSFCDALEELPSVAHVNLRGTRITDKSVVRIGELSHLRVLDIRESTITPDGVQVLRSMMPQCNILDRSD